MVPCSIDDNRGSSGSIAHLVQTCLLQSWLGKIRVSSNSSFRLFVSSEGLRMPTLDTLDRGNLTVTGLAELHHVTVVYHLSLHVL